MTDFLTQDHERAIMTLIEGGCVTQSADGVFYVTLSDGSVLQAADAAHDFIERAIASDFVSKERVQ